MQRRLSSRCIVRLVATLALVGTFAILGCSDDDDDEIRDVNVGLRINDANAAMLGGEDFTFANGVGQFACEWGSRCRSRNLNPRSC
jgi:hypothetical protein